MTNQQHEEVTLEKVGTAIWQRLTTELNVTPVDEFKELLDLKDLAGNSTGSIEVYSAPNLLKMSVLSITLGPGRYFNIHVIPTPKVAVPRYLYEGMLKPDGSQISMDLFPDSDIFLEIEAYLEQYREIIPVYEKARLKSEIVFEASRQAHMRAFSSPLFLCAFDAPESRLGEIESFAQGYLDGWLTMYRAAPELSADEAAQRQRRRDKMQNAIMALDPDRNRVVAIYGEATTRAIESASML